jgi:hypothetical protein
MVGHLRTFPRPEAFRLFEEDPAMSSSKPINGPKVRPEDQTIATGAEVPYDVHASKAAGDSEPVADISEATAMAKAAVKSVEAAKQFGRVHKNDDRN